MCFPLDFSQSNLWRLKILVPLFFSFIGGGAIGTAAILKYADLFFKQESQNHILDQTGLDVFIVLPAHSFYLCLSSAQDWHQLPLYSGLAHPCRRHHLFRARRAVGREWLVPRRAAHCQSRAVQQAELARAVVVVVVVKGRKCRAVDAGAAAPATAGVERASRHCRVVRVVASGCWRRRRRCSRRNGFCAKHRAIGLSGVIESRFCLRVHGCPAWHLPVVLEIYLI